jgi:HAD superfamily hydrolase (TIGR01484 family)
MSGLLCDLLDRKPVAVIGGGKYDLFRKQLISKLRCPVERLRRLYLFPTTSTAFYRYEKSGWRRVYVHNLTLAQRRRIFRAFKKILREVGYTPPLKVYGKIIEDRGTQVTFSALGQDVVKVLGERGVLLKKEWKRKNTPLKLKIARRLQKELPDLEVRAAGYTSIDVTRKGIDKAYGIRQIQKYLKVPIRDMIFIGDALYPGGNDYAARRTGVKYVQVSGPKEVKKLIRFIIGNI